MIRVKPMIISCYVSGLRSCVLGVGAACLWCIQCGLLPRCVFPTQFSLSQSCTYVAGKHPLSLASHCISLDASLSLCAGNIVLS